MRLAVSMTVAMLCGITGAQAGTAVLDGPGSAASLRAGPDPLYEAVYSAADGTRVETLEATIGWTLVRLPNGASGWVLNAHLVAPGAYRPATVPETAPDAAPAQNPPREISDTPPVPKPEQPEITEVARYTSVVWPKTGRLNLRTGPGETFDVLRPMERGDWVAVLAVAGDWVKVEHESGVIGWTHSDYLTR